MCLPIFAAMLDTMKALPANMRKAANGGFINATDCADYLAKKGMPFRDAYKITGQLVYHCIASDCTLEQMPLREMQEISPLFDEDVYTALSMERCVEGRSSYGGPSPTETTRQIELLEAFIDRHSKI